MVRDIDILRLGFNLAKGTVQESELAMNQSQRWWLAVPLKDWRGHFPGPGRKKIIERKRIDARKPPEDFIL